MAVAFDHAICRPTRRVAACFRLVISLLAVLATSAASVLTGQLGVVYGHPLIVSEQMRLADTDGKVTDAGNGTDTGRVLAVNRSQWRVGFRREIAIETERNIQKRQNLMVVSMRIAFNERTGSRSSATHTALQYNITGVA